MTVPYAPVTFTSPPLNPAVGGYGPPAIYVSPSQYKFAPTAMDTSSLVPNAPAAAQEQALYDTLRRASAWADRYVYGFDPAAKGASLAASLSVTTAYLPIIAGELRLVCDYKPIIQFVGCTLGTNPSAVTPLTTTVAAQCRFGRRTIYIPINNRYWFGKNAQSSATPIRTTTTGMVYAVWSYVNGYPHTSLATSVVAGATTLNLTPTNGTNGLFGVFVGTHLTIYDGATTETVTVKAISGATLTVSALRYAHTAPPSPDFLPVTALPADVQVAVIFFTTALIKTRGDNSLVLDEITEPEHINQSAGNVEEDVAYAMELLDPWRIRLKGRI